MPYLKEAALLEDVANELIQVHQTLVVADVMGENRQHHGVLWRTQRERIGYKKRARVKAAKGRGEEKQEEMENKDHSLYERRSEGSVIWEKVWWRDCEKEKRERGWWREQTGRNQSASHYLLSGALQQRDEIIKNPIAALREGMTERREIHIWTGQSNRTPFRHVDTLPFGQTPTAPPLTLVY